MTTSPHANPIPALAPGRLVSLAEFDRLCHDYPDLQLERTATGELIAMPPTGSETGILDHSINGQLYVWNQQFKLGKCFSSSAGFTLPNGAIRSPDAAWISNNRWNALDQKAKKKFAPICPDFVIELVSPSDQLQTTQAKMHEYIENGARLGWLIDPQNKQVTIYRGDRPAEVIENPAKLSGENVLPEFELNLAEIW
ncbi:protein of unknown function DUF820 [Thalassoporum mexicanum PCC 7367]|uniref:Uma2 family endonuclease n=1 Tax=Thalassoporum mexicanum TaxID=3457544 RepID=UPI00029FD7B2|nr:Uma2 family endonuclease [Pseudanabaena sp. PCC 7367]AFY70383.1 protein of unknown function DUF820 [Pseudanabaena sp. PCC 7367]